MPFCEIPKEKLEFISLFGFDIVGDNGDGFLAVKDSNNKLQIVDKEKPHLWFDDVTDAMQLGATALINSP